MEILTARYDGFTDDLHAKWFPKVITSESTSVELEPIYFLELGGVFLITLGLFVSGWLLHLFNLARDKLGLFQWWDRPTHHVVTLPPTNRIDATRDLLRELNETGRLPKESVRTRLLMHMVLQSIIKMDEEYHIRNETDRFESD